MNSVSLIGRLTRDPESRSGSSGIAITRFTVAVDRRGGKDEVKTADFIPVTCFGKTAELVQKYLGKGRLVGVTGRIQTGSYEKEGRKIYTTDVIADRVEFLDKASTPGADTPSDDGWERSVPAGFTQLTDDDIPF